MFDLGYILKIYKLNLESEGLKIDGKFRLEKEKLNLEKLQSILGKNQSKSSERIRNSRELQVGDVYEMITDTVPITVAIIEVRKKTVIVALMSYAWELATPYDLIVDFEHPLGDRWIVETNLMIELGKKEFMPNFYFIGKLKNKDAKILVDFKKGKPLPSNKTGKGFPIPEKREFKEIEYKRYKVLFSLLMQEFERIEAKEMQGERIKVAAMRVDEKDSLKDILDPKIKDFEEYLKNIFIGQLGEMPAVAGTQVKPIEDNETKIIFDKDKGELHFLFPEKFIGKPVNIILDVKGKTFPLFHIKSAPIIMSVLMDKDKFLQIANYIKVRFEDE